MKMLSLPNGKLINPFQIELVSVRSHFWNSKQFYVEMSLRDRSTEYIEEKLTKEQALAVREKYLTMVRDLCADAGPYEAGYQEGYEQGRKEGSDSGKADGHKSGHTPGSGMSATDSWLR
jgi:hypothetical protein